MAGKSNGFAALGQSLLSMGETIISGNPISSKPKKKNHKKKNSKPKEASEAIHQQTGLQSNILVDDNFDDWQSQSKPKKPKAKTNGESVNGFSVPASVNGAVSASIPRPSPPEKAKKTTNGSEHPEKKELKETTVNEGKVVPLSKPRVLQKQQQKQAGPVKVGTPAVEAHSLPVASAATSSAKPQMKQPPQKKKSEVPVTQDVLLLIAYTRHLEHSLTLGCGSGSVEAVRSAYPNLTFSFPVPAPPSPASQLPDIPENPTKSEFADIKALLLAKQSEVIFYKNMLAKQNQPTVQQPFIEEKKVAAVKNPKEVASKVVQCDMFVEKMPQQQQHQAPPPPAPQSSTQADIEKSLLDQILSLTNESTRFKQRCDIANRDIEALKKECARLEAECKKIKTKTTKETKELVKMESDIIIKKLQDEIAEKDAQITDKSAQIDSLQAQLEPLQATVSQLKQSEQASANRLADLEMTMNNLTAQKDAALSEKDELTTTVEKVTSEMSWLRHSLTEKESEVVQARDECSNLRIKLETTKQKFETLSLAQQGAEKEMSTAGETIERLKGELTALKSNLSSKEEEIVAAKAETSAKQAELDQAKEELAHATSELASAEKEMKVKVVEPPDHEVILANDAPVDCQECFVLKEVNAELKNALVKVRDELVSLQGSLELEVNE